MEDQIKDLLAKITTLQGRADEQDKTIAKLVKDHKGLMSKAAAPAATTQIGEKAAELPKIPKAPVKIGDKKYQWNVPVFQMPGTTEKITAEEASTDADLLAKIVALEGQGLLKELV